MISIKEFFVDGRQTVLSSIGKNEIESLDDLEKTSVETIIRCMTLALHSSIKRREEKEKMRIDALKDAYYRRYSGPYFLNSVGNCIKVYMKSNNIGTSGEQGYLIGTMQAKEEDTELKRLRVRGVDLRYIHGVNEDLDRIRISIYRDYEKDCVDSIDFFGGIKPSRFNLQSQYLINPKGVIAVSDILMEIMSSVNREIRTKEIHDKMILKPRKQQPGAKNN